MSTRDETGPKLSPWGGGSPLVVPETDTREPTPEPTPEPNPENVKIFDGETAVAQPGIAKIAFGPDHHLRVQLAGTSHRFALNDLRRLPHNAGGGMVLSCTQNPGVRISVLDLSLIFEITKSAPNLDARAPFTQGRRMARLGLGAVLSVALILFGLVPLMATQLARALPAGGEIALGARTFEQIRTMMSHETAVLECDGAPGRAALDAMTVTLSQSLDLPYPLTVRVLDHELENAFALPGGQVVLFSGLIKSASGPNEIAAILAHEIGHVVHRDPTTGALRSAGSVGVLGLMFGDFAGGTVSLLIANQLINATYSRRAEARADEFAHDVLTRNAISPANLGKFFERLIAEGNDDGGALRHFNSHPQMQARIDAAQSLSADVGDVPVLSDADWAALRRICKHF